MEIYPQMAKSAVWIQKTSWLWILPSMRCRVSGSPVIGFSLVWYTRSFWPAQEGSILPPLNTSFSPDEALLLESCSLVVLDDFKAYQELLKRMITSLSIQIEHVEENSHNLIVILHPAMSGKVAFPINNAIKQSIKALCHHPSCQ